MDRNIIERNKDIEHILLASCQYGFHRAGEANFDKLFCLLAMTDPHRCRKQLESAVQYLNYYDAIDCGICLGDIQGETFNESDGSWYTSAINRSNKEFFTVLGNHDLGNSCDIKISATPKMGMNRFMLPVKDKMGISELKEPYYVKLFDKYKIALIVLNTYDVPDILDTNGNYKYSRGLEMFSQQQLDWLISTLEKLESGYHVIIAMHNFFDKYKAFPDKWTQVGTEIDNREEPLAYGNAHIVPSIINAWIHGKKFKAEYPAKISGLPTLNINCDFSPRGQGDFICYLSGHWHMDTIAVDEKHPTQKIIYLASMAMDLWQNGNCDLPRAEGTKAEDLLTAISLHTKKREIRLVRIGSNYTLDLEERMYKIIDY